MANKPANPQVDESSVEQSELYKQALIRSLLSAIGEDPDREGLRDTPKRVVKSWKDFFSGYKMDPKKVLGTTFDAEGYDQMILLRDIEMYSHCEHHMVNFNGRVHIAYIPGKRVVGLSKLARLVEVFSRRLQIQERLTDQIAETMWKVLKPRGVAVMIEAKHFCMCARGVGKQNSVMRTTALKGLFKTDSAARNEFLGAIR